MSKQDLDLLFAMGTQQLHSLTKTHYLRDEQWRSNKSQTTIQQMAHNHPGKRAVITPLGKFDKVVDAALAMGLYGGTIRDRIRRGVEGYAYIDGNNVRSGNISQNRKGILTGSSNGSSRKVKTPLGKFNTVKEAVLAHDTFKAMLYKWMKQSPTKYYYI